MNSLYNFIVSNSEALTVGVFVMCVGTICLGVVAFVLIQLDSYFDSLDEVWK